MQHLRQEVRAAHMQHSSSRAAGVHHQSGEHQWGSRGSAAAALEAVGAAVRHPASIAAKLLGTPELPIETPQVAEDARAGDSAGDFGGEIAGGGASWHHGGKGREGGGSGAAEAVAHDEPCGHERVGVIPGGLFAALQREVSRAQGGLMGCEGEGGASIVSSSL
eukprot:scaffold47697_cov16-Tisochrysis_lutea.AAC.1